MIKFRRSSSHIAEERRQKIKGGFLSSLRQKLHKNGKSRNLCGESPQSDCKESGENSEPTHQSSRSKKRSLGSRLICPVPSPILCTRRCSSTEDSGSSGGIPVRLSRDECDKNCLCQQEMCASCQGETMNVNNIQINSSGIDDSSPENLNVSNNEPLASYSEGAIVHSNQHAEICAYEKSGLPSDNPENYVPSICNSPKIPNKAAKNSTSSLSDELFKLSRYGWYWGPITRSEAEGKLVDQCDGAFLVRDSSDDKYLLSLSFRSYGRTLHTRIEYCNGIFSFNHQSKADGLTSVVDLINHTVAFSLSEVFCYIRSRFPGSPPFPVRLTKPISRFTQVRSLQYLCRFVIRQYTRFDHIQNLPLPQSIKGYIEEGYY